MGLKSTWLFRFECLPVLKPLEIESFIISELSDLRF
jgi:hypothetical protein